MQLGVSFSSTSSIAGNAGGYKRIGQHSSLKEDYAEELVEMGKPLVIKYYNIIKKKRKTMLCTT